MSNSEFSVSLSGSNDVRERRTANRTGSRLSAAARPDKNVFSGLD